MRAKVSLKVLASKDSIESRLQEWMPSASDKERVKQEIIDLLQSELPPERKNTLVFVPEENIYLCMRKHSSNQLVRAHIFVAKPGSPAEYSEIELRVFLEDIAQLKQEIESILKVLFTWQVNLSAKRFPAIHDDVGTVLIYEQASERIITYGEVFRSWAQRMKSIMGSLTLELAVLVVAAAVTAISYFNFGQEETPVERFWGRMLTGSLWAAATTSISIVHSVARHTKSRLIKWA